MAFVFASAPLGTVLLIDGTMFTNNPDRLNYQKRIELSFVVSLLLVTIGLRLAANVQVRPKEVQGEVPVITVEEIPPTQQGKKRPLPPKPAIPIPSEEEWVPEDETIEEIDLKYYADSADQGGAGMQDAGVGAPTIIPPRPIAWVIPEYPEEDRKRGIRGEVKLGLQIDSTGKVIEAIVIENETGSERCAQAAIKAALASRFIPAMKGGKPTSYWLIQPYRFDLSK